MVGNPKLILQIYSGRENPVVEISQRKYDAIIHGVSSQTKLFDNSIMPNLGEIGFSLSSNNSFIEIYKRFSSIQLNDKVTYSRTNYKLFEAVRDLFFNTYTAPDAQDLERMVRKNT
jgi:hypothetical protein